MPRSSCGRPSRPSSTATTSTSIVWTGPAITTTRRKSRRPSPPTLTPGRETPLSVALAARNRAADLIIDREDGGDPPRSLAGRPRDLMLPPRPMAREETRQVAGIVQVLVIEARSIELGEQSFRRGRIVPHGGPGRTGRQRSGPGPAQIIAGRGDRFPGAAPGDPAQAARDDRVGRGSVERRT